MTRVVGEHILRDNGRSSSSLHFVYSPFTVSPSHFSHLSLLLLSLNSPPPLSQTGSLAGCLAQLTADQSSVCQTGLSPGTANGAPFSCLVGGGTGRERWERLGVGVGVQIEKTDRNSSREERQRDKQAEGRRKGYN